MRLLLLSLTILISGNLFAQRKVSALTPEEEAKYTFEQFKTCKKDSAEKEITNCVAALTTSQTKTSLNQKIAWWLFNLSELGSMETCPAEKLELFPQTSAKDYKALKCVPFKTKHGKGKALFYFVDEAGQMKIEGIQFL